MRTKRFLLALLVLFLAMASLVLIEAVRLFHLFQAQNASDRPGAQLARLEEYVQQHSRVKPGRVLTFEWEEAYLDRMPYGTGESVRQLTGYAFALRPLNDGRWNRLLFFKDGQLVSEIVYDSTCWGFPEEMDGFTADTVFCVQASEKTGRYVLTVAEGYEGTAKWGEEAAAAQQGESGAPPAQTPPAFGAA